MTHNFTSAETERGIALSKKARKEGYRLRRAELRVAKATNETSVVVAALRSPVVAGTLAYVGVTILEKAFDSFNTPAQSDAQKKSAQDVFSKIEGALKTVGLAAILGPVGALAAKGNLDWLALKTAILAYIASGGNLAGLLSSGGNLLGEIGALVSKA